MYNSLNQPKTTIYHAYFNDKTNKKVHSIRITRNEYIYLTTQGFQCFRIQHSSDHLEYIVQTDDFALFNIHFQGRKLKTKKMVI